MPNQVLVRWCAQTTISAIDAEIRALASEQIQSLCLFCAETHEWNKNEMDGLLQNLSIPVFGAVFPRLINNNDHFSSGSILVGLPFPVEVHPVQGLSQGSAHIETQIAEIQTQLSSAKAIGCVVDGLAENIERLVEALYSRVGMEISVVGGGAGSLSFQQAPCLFSSSGMLEDAALIACLPAPLSGAARHGWQVLDGPYLVTKSRGNVIQELNYMPAFPVYKSDVEKYCENQLEIANFFDIAKTYPLGIESIDGDITVRDPLKVEENALICVGEIPENATIYLLKGTQQQLIDAAGEAAAEASRTWFKNNTEVPQLAFIVDCISRVLFLDEDFSNELYTIKAALPAALHCVGVLSLGEIGNAPSGPLELMNKSTLVAII